MRVDIDFIKKRYYDTRVGVTVFSPIIALVNFIMIAYNFTIVKTAMSIWVFGVLVTLALIFILTIIGVIFRTRQQKVDLGIMYVENKEQLMTDILILDAMERFYPPNDPKAKRLNERIRFLKAHLGELK